MRGRRGRSWRRGLAWGAASVALAALAVVLWRPPAIYGPTLDLGPTTLAVLDTVSLSGRRVRAQLDGVVESVEADGTVWLGVDGRAMAVALGEPAVADSLGIAPERRLLVAGRLRRTDGRRWLDADAWTLVDGVAVAPPDTLAAGDGTAPRGDRSPARQDRSASGR